MYVLMLRSKVWDYVPDVAFTFAVSLLLALVVEGPFRRLEKRFILRTAKTVKSNG